MAKRDLLHSPADGRALSTNLLHWEEGAEGLVFTDRMIINVEADEDNDRLRSVGRLPHIVARVSCIRCREVLGYKYIQVDDRQQLVQNGMVNFKKEMVQRRHGDEIIDGEEPEAVQVHIR